MGIWVLAVVSRYARMACTMSLATGTVAWRTDFDTKITPIISAPALAATRADSTSFIPHTLTRTVLPALASSRISFEINSPGLGALMSASPARKPAMSPKLSYFFTSWRVLIPLKAKNAKFLIMPCSRAFCTSLGVFSMSTVKVCKSRLFTPSTLAPARSAAASSSSLTTSTRGSIPSSRDFFISADVSVSLRMDSMSKTVSAPKARAS
mmetsp:Transcript_3712/g.6519  ORF Transcript_3712/g.6519 Transcript_3712/m.6519 type:complete len:209 (-) Transcript_3712:527-1153(-)